MLFLSRFFLSIFVSLGIAWSLTALIPEWTFWPTFFVWLLPLTASDLLDLYNRLRS